MKYEREATPLLTTMPTPREARLRHAAHYETVMRDLNELYLEGGAALETGLLLFDLEWPNVLAGWSGARDNLGVVYRKTGDTAQALRLFEQCLVIFRGLNDRRGEALALWNVGMTLSRQGDFGRAAARAEKMLDLWRGRAAAPAGRGEEAQP
jgi:tetratricopeptide (TPR) repeat protein